MKKRKILNCIGEVLDEKGRTNIWLAKKLGRHINTISKWVQNVQQPHLEVFYEISVVLECDILDLIVSTKNVKKGEK
jgi:putative transcriptional regulator